MEQVHVCMHMDTCMRTHIHKATKLHKTIVSYIFTQILTKEKNLIWQHPLWNFSTFKFLKECFMAPRPAHWKTMFGYLVAAGLHVVYVLVFDLCVCVSFVILTQL